MKYIIEGRELEAVENPRVGEVCEAEKALSLSMDGSFGAQMAIGLFIAMRRADPVKPVHLLADEVMRADMSTLEEVAEENPPAEAPEGADETDNMDRESQLTSGHRLSVPSA